MSERDHNGTLYTTHMYMCKYTIYEFVHEETGVTSPTTKTLICTDIAAKALQFTQASLSESENRQAASLIV